MSTQPTVDREPFQKLLASAFVVQQSCPRKAANTRGLAVAPLFVAPLPLPKLDEDILISGALLAHWARALSPHDTGLPTKADAVATPPPMDELPSAADSMDACSAEFQVRTPELKTAQPRLRDPWMPLLLSLVIALALLVIGMLGRVTRWGTAHPQGPPLRVSSEPDAVPVQPERVRQADPSPPPPIRSDSLVVYQNGKVIFRLKSPPPRGESPAPAPAPASQRKTNVQLLQRVEPKYPEAAKQQHIQGLVVLEAKVDEGGAVQQLTVISGNSMLATAASNAVRKWRFKPLVQNNRAVPFQSRVKVNFVLLDSPGLRPRTSFANVSPRFATEAEE